MTPDLDWGQTWPTAAEFTDLARTRRVIPVVRRVLADDLTPVGVYRRLAAGQGGSFILESAETSGRWHRWSFVGVRASATLTAQGAQATWLGTPPVSVPQQGAPLDVLRGTLQALHTERLPGLPPLTGGLVGSLGWDACWYFHPDLPRTAEEELHLPDMVLMLVAEMVAIDHADGSAWLIANCINTDDADTGVGEAYTGAVARLDAQLLTGALGTEEAQRVHVPEDGVPHPVRRVGPFRHVSPPRPHRAADSI